MTNPAPQATGLVVMLDAAGRTIAALEEAVEQRDALITALRAELEAARQDAPSAHPPEGTPHE